MHPKWSPKRKEWLAGGLQKIVKKMTPNLRKITLNTPINSYNELGITPEVSSRDIFRGIELVIPNPSAALKDHQIPKLGGMTVTLGS